MTPAESSAPVPAPDAPAAASASAAASAPIVPATTAHAPATIVPTTTAHAPATTAPATSTVERLGAERYVLLTTFRKTGVPVPTPVWIGQDGDTLLVTTRDGSGKVKRLRNSGRVELTPCDIRGNVADGAATVIGTAEVFTDPESRATLTAIFEEKYADRWREMRVASAKRDPEPVSVTVRITLT